MRGNTTFENVVGRVNEISAYNHDETIPVVDMEFDDLNYMWIGSNRVEVLPSAQRLLANRLRVPYSYLVRCPQELQARNLNYWLRQEQKSRETLFCRFNSNRLRAVFTERYTAIDHMEVLSLMVDYGFNPESECHYALDENLLVLKVPDFTRGFGFGDDRIVPGISISNSEVGILALSIEAYFYRLVCSNGLIAKTSVASKFKHISRKGVDEFPYILRQVVSESEQAQRRFEISTQSIIDDPVATITTFNRRFQLSKQESEIVMESWQADQGKTMFDIINAYTYAAQNNSLTVEESFQLERVGGLILSMVKE